MATIDITREKCSCPPETCVKNVDPPEDCIQRLDGDVISARCPKCQAQTWHHNGNCIRCARIERDAVRPPLRVVESRKSPSSLTLTIKCGNEFQVTDKKQVAKILKILLGN